MPNKPYVQGAVATVSTVSTVATGRFLTLSAVIAASLGAAACVPLAATGIALGAMAVIDRRTIGAQTEDQGIELKALAELRRVIKDAGGISVTSFNRRVLLTGQALSSIDKQNAGAVVAGLPNVRGVYNELDIANKSSFGSSAADTTLTTKVKAVLLRDQVVPGNSVKVKTEQTIVYLMGLVTNAEAQVAADLTSQVAGVSRVITVFEILSDNEAKKLSTRLGSRPSAPPAAAQPLQPTQPMAQPVPAAPPAGVMQPQLVTPAPAVGAPPSVTVQPVQPVPSATPVNPGVVPAQPGQPPLVAPPPR